jgi:hypothetical protein
MKRLADWLLAAMAAAASSVLAAMAQAPPPSMNYTSFDATSAKAVQIGYYAFARKDCTAGPLPTIRVVEPPKSGTLTIRRGVLTTNGVAGCPSLRVPAEVAYYKARPGAAGSDHIIYIVTNAVGGEGAYDVTINIKEAPKTSAPTPGRPI